MTEIRNYSMNFGSGPAFGLNLLAQVSLRRNKPLRIRLRLVVGRDERLLRPEIHG
jgi:hypothetical protein